LGLFVTSGAGRTSAVAAIHASAEPIGRPFHALSLRIAAQVEHKWLLE
jgi:hypothetical protein